MRPFTICLWFDDQAEEAATFYTGVFPDGEISNVSRYGEDAPGGRPAGSVMAANFRANGTDFMALNGGPAPWRFDEAISLVVHAETQEEADRYWEVLRAEGETQQCGWVKDRFGLVWQVVPDGLESLLGDPDPGRARRAMQAMLGMERLDLGAMRAAADAG